MPRASAHALDGQSAELLTRLLSRRDFSLAAVRSVSGVYLDALSRLGEDPAARAALDRSVAAFLGDAYVKLCDGRWCSGREGRDGSAPAVLIGRRARSLRMKLCLLEDLTLLRETRDRDAVAGWMALLQRRDDALADALRSAVSYTQASELGDASGPPGD